MGALTGEMKEEEKGGGSSPGPSQSPLSASALHCPPPSFPIPFHSPAVVAEEEKEKGEVEESKVRAGDGASPLSLRRRAPPPPLLSFPPPPIAVVGWALLRRGPSVLLLLLLCLLFC